ncbi:MAG: mechanosensitive ion channel family protein [Sedimentibacter sp.]
MQEFLQVTFLNNTILNYLIFFAVLIFGVVAIKILKCLLVKRFNAWAKKAETKIDDQLGLSLVKKLCTILYLATFYFSIKVLNLNSVINNMINMLSFAITIAVVAMFISLILTFVVTKYIENKIDSANRKIITILINRIVKIVIWSIALVLFLDNIDIKITSLITGFGIGGIALAFAAQSILVDLFCYFTIFFDKPFEIGDFIIVGEQMGTVEYIGMKNSRLRALNGEQIILANSDLTKSRISNYKSMVERRVLFRIGVTYNTTASTLKEIPGLIKKIIESVQETRFGRVHFCAYGAYSLDYEIAYYVLTSNYDKYMDINQEINLRIKEEFDKQGIEFAFPTQTIQLDKGTIQSSLKNLD